MVVLENHAVILPLPPPEGAEGGEAIFKTLPASTLFETLISMIIIMMCFGISLTIYLNVSASNNSMQKLKAQLLLNSLALEAKEKNNFVEEYIETESLIIEKTIRPYPQTEKLGVLTYIAKDKNEKLLAKHSELVIVP